MRKLVALIVIFQAAFFSVVAQDSVQATIVLIGDAGMLTGGKQLVVEATRKIVPMNRNTTVIYLGDNLYKTGLPDDLVPSYEIAKAPLDSQITIAGTSPVNVYFIPGNHDWANGGRNGYASILRVQNYIDILGNKYVTQLPRDGCPGPVEVKINNDVTLVIVDSQWWLHEADKPGIESDCPTKTKTEVITQLDEILSANNDKLVIFAMHHPMRSYGQHGGYFTLKQHIFPFTDANKKLYIPLPVLGSAYPLTRAVFGTSQDLKHPFYQEMINAFEKVAASHPNVIFVSGHEHTLQMIQDSTRNYIVSGSGSKTSRVSKSRNTLFASSDNGFATLQVLKNKSVRANFYNVYGDSVVTSFTKNILDFSRVPDREKKDTLREPEYAFKDSVYISASDQYKHFSGFKNFFLGKNYRPLWNEAVELKVFNIRKEQGGFKILSLGGGKQTKSLKIQDKNGKEWTLRTIEKDPEKALPENLRGTIGEAIVTDMVSAANPYAPFVVPALAVAAGVPAANPKFFFVPDDPAFGKYQPLFANSVVMLENREPTNDGTETKSTGKILTKLLEDNDHHIDQPAVLRARLLDMLIGDWDRHSDQWRWGTNDTGVGKLYYPVPKDRDQAFFDSDGILLKYLSRNQMPFLQGFNKKIKNINGLNFVARDFDRFFMNGLNKDDWKSISDSFVTHISDGVIDNAVKNFPFEIAKIDSGKTAKKLKSRRDRMGKYALTYYKFLAKQVTVIGSNESEYFHLENEQGKLKLSVYKKDEKTDSATVMYRRVFNQKQTKELVLYGLNGNDKFDVAADISSRIKLRIVGGKGSDTFNLPGNIRKTIYDLSTEKNVVTNRRRTDNDFSSNPSVLEYRSTGFQYNKFIFPQLNFGYNAEDGVLVGVGFSSRTYAFRKEPYASSQKLSTLASLSRGAFQATYQGEFNHIISKYDLAVNAQIVAPTLNNFFGYGNNSEYDKSKSLYYYRTRYKYVATDLLLRRRYNDIFQFSAGGVYYRYWNDFEDNDKRILANPADIGSDSLSIFSVKHYAGLRLKFDIKYINSETMPTRGITWLTEFSSVKGLNDNSRGISEIQSNMVIYASISDLSKVSGVLRFGGARIFSDKYEFFQAKTLGFNNYLRGFRRDRFAGQGAAYGSAEARFRLFRSKSYVLPGDVGLLGFFDIGRVWVENERSDKWHNSYGGGIYFIPFNTVMVSASLGISEEDKLFNFSIGTKFNLTF